MNRNESRRNPWRRVAFWTVLPSSLASIVCFGATYSYIWVPLAFALSCGTAIVLAKATSRGGQLPWDPLLWPVLGFGLMVFFQWALRISIYPAQTLAGFIQLVACGAALFLALTAFQSPTNLERAATIIWLFTGILSSEALLQYYTANGRIGWFHDASYATPIGPYIYHNHYAGCIDLLLPIAIFAAFRVHSTNEPGPIIWARRGLVPALALASVVVSQSRGGVLALLFELVCAAVIFQREVRSQRKLLAKVLGGAACILSFTLLVSWQGILSRFLHLGYHDVSTLDRLTVAKTCLQIFATHHWFGSGFNTFSTIYPSFQQIDTGQQWLQAHNDYAQMLAETGVFGLFFVLWFLAVFAHRFVKASLDRHPGRLQQIRKAALVGCSGFLFHSFGDFEFHSPANAVLFFLIAGIAISKAIKTSERAPRPSVQDSLPAMQ